MSAINPNAKQAWLVKSEPDDYSFADLQRDGASPWTGVRNYQARNWMRDSMCIGDPVLFYHSNIPTPEVVGIATVASTPYPDPTQFDQASEYFDPKSDPNGPRWILVDIAAVELLPKTIPLSVLRNDPKTNTLPTTQRGTRLSLHPVPIEVFHHICNQGGIS
jgi:predicted RNA-binding protein with PUA-like domain